MAEMIESKIDWIGRIPKSWIEVRIKDIGSLKTGKTPSTTVPEWFDGELVWYTPSDFESLDLAESCRSLSMKAKKDNVATIIPPNSVMVIGIGGTAGKVAFTSKECSCNQQITAIVPNSNCNARFLLYFMYVCSDILKETALYTTLPIINNQYLGNWHICMGEKTEQDKIVAYLDRKCSEIDALVKDIKKQIIALEDYRCSIISETVTKGLNRSAPMKDSGTEWLGLIPDKWNVSRIGAIYTLRNTKVSDMDFAPLSVTMKGVVPQLENAAKTNAHDDRKLVKKGDFCINSRSDRRGSCGISPYDGSVSLINTILAPVGEMNPRYYNWLFHTTLFADEFYKWGHGIVADLWTTGWQEMKRILIPSPPLEEQEAIADYLDSKCTNIDEIIELKNKQLENLADYKKSLIFEHVTGKKEL